MNDIFYGLVLLICIITSYLIGFVVGIYRFKEYKDKYKNYLDSPFWRDFRIKVLKQDDFRCVRCGSEINLDVHHLTYKRVGKEKIHDCVTLCRTCHNTLHDKKAKELSDKRFLKQSTQK